jgi:hypothetical protein
MKEDPRMATKTLVTPRTALVGLVALALAASQGAALADWKTNAAKKTVGRAARAGMENAAREAAVDATLGAVGSAVPAPGDIRRGMPDRGTAIGSTAGEGIEAAMTAANVATSIDGALEVADAAKRVNKVRKAVR